MNRKAITKRAVFLGLVLLPLFTSCKGAPKPKAEFHIKEVYAGVGHIFILKDDGTLWAGGYNHFGQLGLGDYRGKDGGVHARTLVQVMEGGQSGPPLGDIRDIAPGESHTLLLKNDGTLWAAGDHSYGALGLGPLENPLVSVFTQVKDDAGSPVRGIRAIAAGADSSFFIKEDGSLWAAGYNFYGSLGLAASELNDTFTQVASAGTGVKAVAAGSRHTAILKNDGALWTAGNNHFGQLGLNSDQDQDVFTQVSAAGSDNKAVAAGNNHTVVLKNDGSLWAAGGNYSGQLGLGDFEGRLSFVRAGLDKSGGSPLSGIREIAANGDNTLIMKDDGSLWAAGDNVFGQLGQVNEEFEYARSIFVHLKGEGPASNAPEGLRPITAGARSIYVIGKDGSLRGAGSNRYGQLNLGPEVEDSTELQVIYP
jgi:alpha-tubulin suppressor-like RCC1 family protein